MFNCDPFAENIRRLEMWRADDIEELIAEGKAIHELRESFFSLQEYGLLQIDAGNAFDTLNRSPQNLPTQKSSQENRFYSTSETWMAESTEGWTSLQAAFFDVCVFSETPSSANDL